MNEYFGTIHDSVDIMSELNSTATLNGMTVDNYVAGSEISIDFGSHHIQISSHSNGRIIAASSLNYDSALSIMSQVDQSQGHIVYGTDRKDINYRIIYTSKTLIIFFEYEPNRYSLLIFGDLNKYGSYSGGHFISAHSTYFSPYYPFSFQGINTSFSVFVEGSWITASHLQDSTPQYSYAMTSFYGRSNFNSFFNKAHDVLYSDHSGRSAMLPIEIYVHAGGGKLHPIGNVDNVREISMRSFSAGDTVSYGAEVWRVFPVISKNDPDQKFNSKLDGIAVRVQ